MRVKGRLVQVGSTLQPALLRGNIFVPPNKSFELTALSALRAAKASPAARAAAQFHRWASRGARVRGECEAI
jgi:hypothetical protein